MAYYRLQSFLTIHHPTRGAKGRTLCMVINLLPKSPKNVDSLLHPLFEEQKVLASTGFLVYSSTYRRTDLKGNCL